MEIIRYSSEDLRNRANQLRQLESRYDFIQSELNYRQNINNHKIYNNFTTICTIFLQFRPMFTTFCYNRCINSQEVTYEKTR